jgi:hypothetical protein
LNALIDTQTRFAVISTLCAELLFAVIELIKTAGDTFSIRIE